MLDVDNEESVEELTWYDIKNYIDKNIITLIIDYQDNKRCRQV